LSNKLKSNSITIDNAYKWTEQLLKALDCIHTNKLVHFDIKPSNLLIDNKDNLKIIDFGFCRRGGCDYFGGTKKYLHTDIAYPLSSKPERVDYRNDCYAAGLTIKKMWDTVKSNGEISEIPKNIETLINYLTVYVYRWIFPIKDLLKYLAKDEVDVLSNIYTLDRFNEIVEELTVDSYKDVRIAPSEEEMERARKYIRNEVYFDLVGHQRTNDEIIIDSKILETYPHLRNV
jgi:serine/threonine protein kinase